MDDWLKQKTRQFKQIGIPQVGVMLNHVLNSVFSPHQKILFLVAYGFHSTKIKVLKTMQSTEYSTVNSVITEAIFLASSSFKTRMVICMAHPFMSACETATREND